VEGLTVQPSDWQTAVYAKPYRGSDEQSRIDFGRFNVLSGETERHLIDQITDGIKKLDGLIINQQLPRSIFSPALVETLNSLAQSWPGKIFLVDARNRIPDFHGMICKLNAAEAAQLFGKRIQDNESATPEELQHHARQIYDRTKKPVFITRSRRGILLFDGKGTTEIPALKIAEPTDPVGAGDTVVAALAASLSAGSALTDSASLATLAASVTARKLRQTGTASPDEILAAAAETSQTA
jgi:sugar/nucleoside kinase (ribokinase family)